MPGQLALQRQRAVAFSWRVARGLARRGRKVVRRRPEVSVVVPFYNVEQYLGDCLDSLLAQTFDDLEVVLVDDGSPDGSRAIAEEYVARDPRVRLVTRENGGLGAARNTGIRAARGRWLTFVDSDDLVPPGALAALVDCARETGSEIVVGSVERFDSSSTWSPSWVENVHLDRRCRVSVEEFLPVLRNLYTWNKLYRRDFWDAQGLWFREGVAYEDQPIVTQLLARASSIDVLPDIVYRYRQRDDQSSISQQTATVRDLRDRIEAWQVSHDRFREELSPRAYDGWLQTLFEAHFHWYLTSAGTVDDTYWDELTSAIRRFGGDAPEEVWAATSPDKRVLVRLALDGRREDVQEFVRRRGTALDQWPARVREDGILLELPLHGDPDLPEWLFVLRPEQVRLWHAVENLHWRDRPDGGRSCWISGWAYLRKVDLAEHASTVTVELHHDVTGEVRAHRATEVPRASFPPPRDDLWCDYAPGRFGVEIPVDDLAVGADGAAGADADSWTVWLAVEAAGLVARQPVTRLLRSGAAGHIPATPLGRGDRLVADWQFQQPLRLRVDRGCVVVSDLSLTGRTVRGTVTGDDVTRVARMTMEAGTTVAAGRWVATSPDARTFEVVLPEAPAPDAGRPTGWLLSAWTPRGEWLPTLPAPGAVPPPGTGSLVLETHRNGGIVVSEWVRGATADEVSVSADGVLTVSGRVLGADASRVRLATRNKQQRVVGPVTGVADGRFTATLELRAPRFRFGTLPLTLGDHDVSLAFPDGPGDVPLTVSAALGRRLPLPVDTDELEGRLVRGPAATVRITVSRPIGEARGRYRQHQLRLRGAGSRGPTRGVLFRSYFGEQATDNGVSIQRELRERGSDLPVYWAVQDRSVPVPEGGIPVVVNTPEWYELLGSITYYVDNMYQPEYHQKPDGQVLVQTFHGYPFKQMGHPHWRNLQFSRAKIEAYDARARAWDYLVSPARYATPLLARDFAYPGEVLEIGYPRNDVLLSPEAPELRRRVRESLGIEDGQTAVLYAPTFRDYLSTDDTRAAMHDFFDFAAASRRLGDDHVLLVRGHAFHARSARRVGAIPGCLEVTDYPEVSDLYLAADAAVVDYSSLRFDFGVTGKPMVFHVPDLQRYHDARGWLFDFEPTAPGPLVDTTDEVVDRLLDLDGVRREHAPAYQRFREEYLDLEDGRAAARFVDAVFVPRGDA